MDATDSVDALADAFASTKLDVQLHNTVVLIHEPYMQAHAPKKSEVGVFELPQRIIAIENVLRGSPYTKAIARNFPSSDPQPRASSPKRRAPEEAKKIAAEREAEYTRDLAKLWSDEGLVLGGGYLHWEPVVNTDCLEGSLWSLCRVAKAQPAAYEDLLRVHPASYLDDFARQCMKAVAGGVHTDATGDLYYNRGTLKAARLAAGGAIEAVKALFVQPPVGAGPAATPAARAVDSRGQPIAASFAIIRPPGHHCCTETPAGFCFLSNVAVAAAYARTVLGLERVAIVDTDYHPGDGSQQIFYNDPSVLTISTHVACRLTAPHGDGGGVPPPAKPQPKDMAFVADHAPKHPVCIWPWRRDKGLEYNGANRGEGMNINIPWPCEYVTDEDYEEAMTTIVVPALQAFQPQLILWASGFDAAKGDSLAGTLLSTDAYWSIGRHLATAVPDCPVAAVLEGGYDPLRISLAAENLVRALLGADRPSERRPNNAGDPAPVSAGLASPSGKGPVGAGDSTPDPPRSDASEGTESRAPLSPASAAGAKGKGKKGNVAAKVHQFGKAFAAIEPLAGNPLSFLPIAQLSVTDKSRSVPQHYRHAPEVWAYRQTVTKGVNQQGPWPDWSDVAAVLHQLVDSGCQNLVYVPETEVSSSPAALAGAGRTPSAALVTPLGSPWRPSSPYLGRPEAIMEAVRRRLNRIPTWSALSSNGRPVFGASSDAAIDAAVEHDTKILGAQLLLAHIPGPTAMKRTVLPGDSEDDHVWQPTPNKRLLQRGVSPPKPPPALSEPAARPTRAAAAKAMPDAQTAAPDAGQMQAKPAGKGNKRISLGGKAAAVPAAPAALTQLAAPEAQPQGMPAVAADTEQSRAKPTGKGNARASIGGKGIAASMDAPATGPAGSAALPAIREADADSPAARPSTATDKASTSQKSKSSKKAAQATGGAAAAPADAAASPQGVSKILFEESGSTSGSGVGSGHHGLDSMNIMQKALERVLAEVDGLRSEVKDLKAEVARLKHHDEGHE